MSTDARREALVLAVLDGEWSEPALATRVLGALGGRAFDARELAAHLGARWSSMPDEAALRAALSRPPSPTQETEEDAQEEDAFARCLARITLARGRVLRFHLPPLAGAPLAAFASHLPVIATVAEAAALVGMAPEDEAFFTGAHLAGRRPLRTPHAHYRYRWVAKASGGLRLIEAPKPRLSAMQRALLDRLLVHVPPHEAAHGFRRGRSVRSFAGVHAGSRVVVRIDLEDFFASVGQARVRAIFGALGYPDAIARFFAALTCHRPPPSVLRERPTLGSDLEAVARAQRAAKRFDRPHLPQGAPSSPALASLAAYGLDVRLTALARQFDATYARYADDLAFSGDATLARAPGALISLATRIANDEGFAVHRDKTRVMRSGARQSLGGLVVNASPDVTRERYDALRARLHRIGRGLDVPASAEEREALRRELEGHVSWASARPHRARKLAALLDDARATLARG